VVEHYGDILVMSGDVQKAMAIQLQLLPVHKQLFVEANPIPVKWAVARMGLSQGAMRLPLTPLTLPSQQMLERVMQSTGLI
jgi:4-hydroxy-tetrahydrodipicolinate synthase